MKYTALPTLVIINTYHALKFAMEICDAVPTRVQYLCDDEQFAEVGRLVNKQDDGTHGYAFIHNAISTLEEELRKCALEQYATSDADVTGGD